VGRAEVEGVEVAMPAAQRSSPPLPALLEENPWFDQLREASLLAIRSKQERGKRICLHLDLAVIAAGGKHARIFGIPDGAVGPRFMTRHLLY
jgi:hypothetical protein